MMMMMMMMMMMTMMMLENYLRHGRNNKLSSSHENQAVKE